MNNAVFGKIYRKHKHIKLDTLERRGNYFLSEPNYHATKLFTQTLSAIEMKTNWNAYE